VSAVGSLRVTHPSSEQLSGPNRLRSQIGPEKAVGVLREIATVVPASILQDNERRSIGIGLDIAADPCNDDTGHRFEVFIASDVEDSAIQVVGPEFADTFDLDSEHHVHGVPPSFATSQETSEINRGVRLRAP